MRAAIRPVLAALLLAGAVLRIHAAGAGAPIADVVLTVDHDHFQVDGQSRFLVFVSYFDALDVPDANLRRDFAQFRAWGVDGVRIFPNWWTDSPVPPQYAHSVYPGDTLIDPDGNLRASTLARLAACLARARGYGLLVDLSLNRESIARPCGSGDCPSGEDHGSLTVARYSHAMVTLATALAGPDNRHVLLDVQNESNLTGRPHQGLSDAELAGIIANVKAADPSRIVTASVDPGCAGACAAGRAARTHQDVVASHDPRDARFWGDVAGWVRDLRSHTGKPVYLQEPERYRPGTRGDDGPQSNAGWFTADGLLEAVIAAKQAGAAAWTFHTSAGYYMDVPSYGAPGYPGGDFLDQLRGPEAPFLRTFRAKVDAAAWGIRAIAARSRGASSPAAAPTG